jgi:hypothetical protein
MRTASEFHISRRAMNWDHCGISKTARRETEASNTTKRAAEASKTAKRQR